MGDHKVNVACERAEVVLKSQMTPLFGASGKSISTCSCYFAVSNQLESTRLYPTCGA